MRIGSFGASASTRILPDLIVNFSKRYPDVVIEVREISDVEMPKALHEGIVDVALLVEPEGETFVVAFIATDRLVALVSDQDTLIGAEVTAGALSKHPFVMTKGGSEPLVWRWFGQSDHASNVRHEALQISSILAFVRAGLGASVIAELALPDDINGVRLAGLRPQHHAKLFWRAHGRRRVHRRRMPFWAFVEKNND